MIETEYPVVFSEYALADGSGGGGTFRGGLGLRRGFRVAENATAATFTANLDRFKHPPYGLAGGEPGMPGKLWLQRADGRCEVLASKVSGIKLSPGDTIVLQTAGGGGYGPPQARDPARVATDRADGYCE